MSDAVTASWSPDGKRIAVTSNQRLLRKPQLICGSTEPLYDIWIISDGMKNPGQLATGFSETSINCGNFSPSWSPNGAYITFALLRNDWDIFIMNVENSKPCPLVITPEEDESPIWSPDGRLIAFTSTRNGNEGIYVIEATCNATEPPRTIIAEDGVRYLDPAWSPDGSKIAFSSNKYDNNFDIFVAEISPEGELFSQPQRLTEVRLRNVHRHGLAIVFKICKTIHPT